MAAPDSMSFRAGGYGERKNNAQLGNKVPMVEEPDKQMIDPSSMYSK